MTVIGTDKFTIRKTNGILPWRLWTPAGTWYDSPTHEHAVDIIDHLRGHHHASRRVAREG